MRVLGVRGTCVFSGTLQRPKIPKNRIWGPVEAVSANFLDDLKVAHGVSATDEPKQSGFRAVEPEFCRKYRFARALAVGLMPINPPGGVWGLSRFRAIWGEK